MRRCVKCPKESFQLVPGQRDCLYCAEGKVVCWCFSFFLLSVSPSCLSLLLSTYCVLLTDFATIAPMV
jgi:hypothetical protein